MSHSGAKALQMMIDHNKGENMQTDKQHKASQTSPKWSSPVAKYFEPQLLPGMVAVFYDYQTGKLYKEKEKPLFVFSKTDSTGDGIDFMGWTCMVRNNGDLLYLRDDGNFVGIVPKDAASIDIEEILIDEIAQFKKRYNVDKINQ
jgi:hypothetical protein